MIQISALSLTGPVRERNEDCLFLDGAFPAPYNRSGYQYAAESSANAQLYAVFDGMGGESAGDFASMEAVKLLQIQYPRILQAAYRGLPQGIEAVNRYVADANLQIYNLSSEGAGRKGMGTTFAGLLVAGGQAAAMNAGDSRVYLFRGGELRQLTRDHCESERLVRLGLITSEQALTHKSRNMLNRYFGVPPEEGAMEAEVSRVGPVYPGDVFLLCSDGLTNLVNDDFIRSVLAGGQSRREAVQSLTDKAIENGGNDNVTAVLIGC